MSFKIYNSNHSLNFSGKNLKGLSFKKRNLKGANFSGSDIRGANFTGANLTNANFSNTKAGLNKYWIVISFLLSLITGFHTGAKAIHFYNLLFNKIYYEQIVGAIALTGYIAFLIISRWRGFVNAFMKVVLTAVLTGLLGGVISLAFNQEIISEIIISTVADFNQGIVSAVFITSFLALMIAITNTNVIISYLTTSVITAILIPLLAGDRISQNSWFSIPIITGLTVLIMLVCADISKRILAGDENYAFIRRVVIAAAVSGGTSFRGADLSGANFTGANLRNTDFIKAKLTHTIWHQAKNLELARLYNTILDNPAVRYLLVNKNANNKSYENASLEEAYLVDVDLENVDLKNANLSNANLTKANLSKANLTEANLTKTTLIEACLQEAILSQAQAIGTDFTQADFTGACGLGTWNIDGTTKLDGVNCRFVYLDKNPGIKRDKRPQSGEFAPGEFTKLFQVVVNTVDLIFRNGLDLEALCTALIDVQAKQNTPLEIQNIENKGDGFVVVKVSVSEQTDTTKIQVLQYLVCYYNSRF